MLVRAKKLILHRATRSGLPAHLPFEHPRGAAARFFGAIKGKIGARDKLFRVAAVLRSQGIANAEAKLKYVAPDLKWGLERRQQGGRIGVRNRWVADAGEENGELIAAEPRYGKISVQHRGRRTAAACRTASPAACPRKSLISLKPSMSRSKTAAGACRRNTSPSRFSN